MDENERKRYYNAAKTLVIIPWVLFALGCIFSVVFIYTSHTPLRAGLSFEGVGKGLVLMLVMTAVICSVIGLVLSFIALRLLRRSKTNGRVTDLAWAELILGVLGVVMIFVYLGIPLLTSKPAA